MRLNKIVLVLVLSIGLFAQTKEQININFKGLKINDLIKITSKIINKNILMSHKVNGTVDFISNKPVYKDDILNILIYVLEEKGYTIIDNQGILRVIRVNDASKYNTPVFRDTTNLQTAQMITEVFVVQHSNVDYISSKIRHLISKSAKLVTDKNSNSIVITDFLSNIKTVKSVINIISEDSKKTIEVIDLKNIQANAVVADIKNVAKTVFNEKIEKEKVAVLVNKDTNAIMFVGKKKNVDFLKNYLLDIEAKGSLVEKVVEVIYLKNAESKNVIKILTSIIGNKKYKDPNNKPFASTDEESNAIILMGQKEEISYFKSLIGKLDIDRQQVYVQARIIEVNEDITRDIGLKYGLIAGKSSGDGLLTMAANMGGSAIAIDNLADMGLSTPSVTKGLALGATINLLNQNGAADIVSEPSLLCINNKASSIYVGATKSIKTGDSTTDGGNTNNTYKREDIGLTLKVKPRISNGGKVLLEITTKLEDADETSTNDQPDTYKRELETTAIVNNGESVILGGYIKSKENSTVDKVPFFGDIPVLGSLFKNDRTINSKVNLVVIVTPYIVPKTKDLTYIRSNLAQLKLLEDKYTKDTILRLEEAKLKEKQNDTRRDKKIEELKDGLSDIKDEKTTQQELHNQRVKEMFGI